MQKIDSLIDFANNKKIYLKTQDEIALEASKNIKRKLDLNTEDVKKNFDDLIHQTEAEVYRVYLSYEKEFGAKVIEAYVKYIQQRMGPDNNKFIEELGKSFTLF